jgi:hypothetical protein
MSGLPFIGDSGRITPYRRLARRRYHGYENGVGGNITVLAVLRRRKGSSLIGKDDNEQSTGGGKRRQADPAETQLSFCERSGIH